MTRFFRICLSACFLLAAAPAVPAATIQRNIFGQPVAVLPVLTTHLVSDQARECVYASETAQNAVAIIDTGTLAVVATIPVSPKPGAMALSENGNFLYVACAGSADQAVSVIDLNQRQVTATFSLPQPANGIAAGSGNHLFVSVLYSTVPLYQLNAFSGEIQATITDHYYSDCLLQTSPDHRTLYTTDAGSWEAPLISYDVSSETAQQTAENSNVGGGPLGIVVSHQGAYVSVPGSAGNVQNDGGSGVTYRTELYSSTDVSAPLVRLRNSAGNPGVLTFSPDDSLVFQTETTAFDSTNHLRVFRVANQTLLHEAALTYNDLRGGQINDMVSDATGGLLFLAAGYGAPGTPSSGSIVVLATGLEGTNPGTLLPVITDPPSYLVMQAGQSSAYQITARNQPTSYAATGLPAGLHVQNDSGLITGTPKQGSYSVTLSATNAAGTSTKTLNFMVASNASPPLPMFRAPLMSVTDALGVGLAYQLTTVAPASTFSAFGLPPGLTLDPASGLISGRPKQTGTFRVSVIATNAVGSCSATILVGVNAGQPTLSVRASVNSTSAGGAPGQWTLSRTGYNIMQPMTVRYNLGGNAVNGVDYTPLSGTATFPAGASQTTVSLQAEGDLGGVPAKVVRLSVHPSKAYIRTNPFSPQIVILAPSAPSAR